MCLVIPFTIKFLEEQERNGTSTEDIWFAHEIDAFADDLTPEAMNIPNCQLGFQTIGRYVDSNELVVFTHMSTTNNCKLTDVISAVERIDEQAIIIQNGTIKVSGTLVYNSRPNVDTNVISKTRTGTGGICLMFYHLDVFGLFTCPSIEVPVAEYIDLLSKQSVFNIDESLQNLHTRLVNKANGRNESNIFICVNDYQDKLPTGATASVRSDISVMYVSLLVFGAVFIVVILVAIILHRNDICKQASSGRSNRNVVSE